MNRVKDRSELHSQRLAARVPAGIKEHIQRAADLSGRSLSDFVIASAQAAADETIRRYELIELTARDSRVLAEALLNPPEPNAALRAAFEDYRQFTGR